MIDYPQQIRVGTCTVRILNINQFEIDDSPDGDRENPGFTCYEYFVPDTRNLEPILAILSRHDWTEQQINDAVAAQVEAEERMQRQEGE